MGSSEGRISEFLHKAQRRLTSDLIQLQTKTPLVTTNSWRGASSRTPLAQNCVVFRKFSRFCLAVIVGCSCFHRASETRHEFIFKLSGFSGFGAGSSCV